MNLILRTAKKSDCEVLHQLITELAVYEREPKGVSNTIEQLEIDGFGPSPLFDAFVVENDNEVIGFALTYYRYSTWKGKTLYLEDLYVKEAYRGSGAGKMLFEHCIRFGRQQSCKRMVWQVLDWNTPAIDFYKKYGTTIDTEWYNCSLEIGV